MYLNIQFIIVNNVYVSHRLTLRFSPHAVLTETPCCDFTSCLSRHADQPPNPSLQLKPESHKQNKGRWKRKTRCHWYHALSLSLLSLCLSFTFSLCLFCSVLRSEPFRMAAGASPIAGGIGNEQRAAQTAVKWLFLCELCCSSCSRSEQVYWAKQGFNDVQP